MELRANPDRPAEGMVIEAKLERGRGAVAYRAGQARHTEASASIIVAGRAWGRVRALIDERVKDVAAAPADARWRCSASTAPPTRANSSRWWKTKPAPAS